MASKLVRNLSRFNHFYRNCKSSSYSIMNRNLQTSSSEGVLTIQELSQKLAKVMGFDSGYSPIRSSRSHLTQYLPKSQNELPARTMRESYLVALIPLSTNRRLQDKYTTFLGAVRLGRLLEDMDIFAVMVAQKHIYNPKLPEGVPSPQTLVTALVDRIDISDFTPNPLEDIKISGHVSWVGKSSIETVVWLEQLRHGTWQRITRALFLMAARDPTNTKAAFINPIAPADDREKKIFEGGEQRKKNRIDLEKLHVSKTLPDEEEQTIIHDLYLKTKAMKDTSLTNQPIRYGGLWMEDCKLSNTIFSQPENRNLHNTVFGGFIMRQATELGYALAFTFSKYRPKLKSLSDIKFTKPIQVNSLIHMHAYVVFTHMQFIQITVSVETYDPTTGTGDTTNTLYMTFEVPELVKEVFPKTYHEAMMYIDGRRHFFDIIKPAPNDDILEEAGIVNKSKL